MERILFIDIASEPGYYIMERKSGSVKVIGAGNFSCTKDYDISFPEIPANIDVFYLSLPLFALNCRIIELPFSDKEKILSILPFEVDNIILNGAESVIFDSITLEDNKGKTRVLAVYIKKSILNRILDRLKTFNIDPKIATSLELNGIAKDFNAEKLLSPPEMKPEERINTAVKEIKDNTINLRRGDFSYVKDTEKIQKAAAWTKMLFSAVLIFLAASLFLKTASVKKESLSLQREINSAYSEVFPGDKKTNAGPYLLKLRIKELKDKEDQLIGISPLNLLLKLAETGRGNAIYNEIGMEKGRVALKGEAASYGDIQKIKEDIGAFLNEVNITDSKTSTQGRIIFTISAKEKKP